MKKKSPDIAKISNIELIARQLVEGFITGRHKSPHHGFSVEFAEHRLYNEGENAKHVDWKVFARTDKLYVKRYEEETNLRCLILIDNSSSMRYPIDKSNKLKFSLECAAALAYILNKQRDAFGLCLFSDHIETFTAIKSTSSHLQYLLQLIAQQHNNNDKKKHTSIAPVLHEIAEKIHRRSLIILFSDLFDDKSHVSALYKALQHLKHRKNEIIVFHISDHDTEFNFNFPKTPHEFVDIENGKTIKTNPASIHQEFNRRLARFHQEIKMKCGQLDIDLVTADIKESHYKILQNYLVKRSSMMAG